MRRLLLIAVCAAFLAGVGCSSSTTTAASSGPPPGGTKDMSGPPADMKAPKMPPM